jgi:AraC-like DNA-binding protein
MIITEAKTTIENLRAKLAKKIASLAPNEGLNEVPLSGLHCIKFSRTSQPQRHHWRATLGLVAQCRKEIHLAQTRYILDDAHYIASPIDLPVTSQIVATETRPFLCLRMDFEPLILSEIAAQLDPSPLPAVSQHAIYTGPASEAMLAAALRLLNSFHDPQEARILGPLLQREIYFHLLQSPDGPAIRQFVRAGSTLHAVYAAIHVLRSQLHDDIDIAILANQAGMSRSAFHKRFREATSMSPIQYQKRLRLIEARRLMIEEGENAEQAAYLVGYRSPSQFSREYSRLFGNAPMRDAAKLKLSSEPLYEL